VDGDSRAYGTGELTPEAIRGARFAQRGGAYSPAEVREFLEQVASAMEVLQSQDMAQAMRRELQRSAEISSRVVMAGQEASERLRAQAADDARSIVDDTKQLAEQLRDAAREELRRTREHIEELRRTFIEELRDMYDRIGATLYRFESASKVGELDAAGAALPGAPRHASPPAADGPRAHSEYVASREAGASYEDYHPAAASGHPAPELGEPLSPRAEAGPRAPAWTQLPPDASTDPSAAPSSDAESDPWGAPTEESNVWGSPGDAGQAAAGQAPGDQGSAEPYDRPYEGSPAAETGDWLLEEEVPNVAGPPPVDGESLADDAPPADGARTAEGAGPTGEGHAVLGEPGQEQQGAQDPQDEPLVDLRPIQDQIHPPEPAAGTQGDAVAAPEPAAPPTAEDDARAEAMIAGLDQVLAKGAAAEEPPPLPDPPSLTPANGESAVDPAALATFVLQSLSEGQSRESVEIYLRQTYGIGDAGGYVDAVLQAAGEGGQQH